MKRINYSMCFGREFQFFFFFKKNYIIIKKKNRFFFLKLSYIYYYKNNNNNNKSFIFINYFHYITFFKHIIHYYNKLCSFYFLRLKLKGLGYRIVHLSAFLIKVFFNRSN